MVTYRAFERLQRRLRHRACDSDESSKSSVVMPIVKSSHHHLRSLTVTPPPLEDERLPSVQSSLQIYIYIYIAVARQVEKGME